MKEIELLLDALDYSDGAEGSASERETSPRLRASGLETDVDVVDSLRTCASRASCDAPRREMKSRAASVTSEPSTDRPKRFAGAANSECSECSAPCRVDRGSRVCTRCDAISVVANDVAELERPRSNGIRPCSTLFSDRGHGTMVVGLDSSMTSRDRAMAAASRAIRAQTQSAFVSLATAAVAERMFRSILDSPDMHATRRAGLVEGVVYTASRACGSARSLEEVARAFQTPTPVVAQGARRVAEVVSAEDTACLRPSALDFARRFSVSSGATGGRILRELTEEYAIALERLSELEDESPHAIAAVSLVMAYEHTGRARGMAVAKTVSGVSASAISRITKIATRRRKEIVPIVAKRVFGECTSIHHLVRRA